MHDMVLRIFLSLFLLISSSSIATSEEDKVKLQVAAFHIANVIEQDGSGEYDKILDQLSNHTGIIFDIKVLPIARARALYTDGKYDCLLPLDPVFEQQHQSHLQSIPLYAAKLYAFTPRGEQPIRNIEDLDGLHVGGELGIPYTEKLIEIIGDNTANRLKDLVQMLETNRFDAIIAYTPDILEIFEHEGIEPLSYDPASPLVVYEDSLTCHPTDLNIVLMKKINDALETMGYAHYRPKIGS